MIVNQTINGRAIRGRDLLAISTVFSDCEGTLCYFMKFTKEGKQPFKLNTEKQRTYLEVGGCIRLPRWAGNLRSEAYLRFRENLGSLNPAII
jgi:hypothetical protein